MRHVWALPKMVYCPAQKGKWKMLHRSLFALSRCAAAAGWRNFMTRSQSIIMTLLCNQDFFVPEPQSLKSVLYTAITSVSAMALLKKPFGHSAHLSSSLSSQWMHCSRLLTEADIYIKSLSLFFSPPNYCPSQMQHLAPPSATYAEQQAYRLGIPGFPGHVDRWLIANSRSPQINHLSDYLMLRDPSSEYVTCFVERRCNNVSTIQIRLSRILWLG